MSKSFGIGFQIPHLLDISSLLLIFNFFRFIVMTVTPATPIAHYGAPVEFEGHLMEFIDPEIPNVVFVKYTAILWVDVGSLAGRIPYRFLSIYTRVGDMSIGPLPFLRTVVEVRMSVELRSKEDGSLCTIFWHSSYTFWDSAV